MEDKDKKNSIKFLKVDNHLFNKAKRFDRKRSHNELPIKNKISTIDNKRKALLFPVNQKKMEDEKTPNSILKNISKNSSIKKNSMISKELIFRNSCLNKEEMLLTRFSKANLKPLKLIRNSSPKNVMKEENIIITNIITNNLSKINSSKNLSNKSKSKINLNDINNNENININKFNKNRIIINNNNKKENNVSSCKNIINSSYKNENKNNIIYSKNPSIDTNKKENIKQKEKSKENECIFNKIFCCLKN